MHHDTLSSFRHRIYGYLGKAHDATFELIDAVLTTRHAYSFVELSQSPLFRRRWPSLYEALEDSRPQRQRLMGLYCEQIPRQSPIVLAGDHTRWSRPFARCLPERTHEHSAQGGRGVVTVGQGYSSLAWIPDTWWPADQALCQVHPHLGRVQVRLWHPLHFRQAAAHPLSLIQVQRLDDTGASRPARPLWLAWLGNTLPPLDSLWQDYLRRFAIEHWYRFLKQRLHWTLPQLQDPKAAERWSALMMMASWQLWLARDRVRDAPFPWQKPLPQLTPGWVADSIASLLVHLGTPTQPPKPRGKSPGWQTGRQRTPKPRCPTVRKRARRPKQSPKPA